MYAALYNTPHSISWASLGSSWNSYEATGYMPSVPTIGSLTYIADALHGQYKAGSYLSIRTVLYLETFLSQS